MVAVNLFEASSIIGTIGGSLVGAFVGQSLLGWVGALIGFPAGAVIGWFLPPFLIFAVFLVLICLQSGPKEALDLLRPRSSRKIDKDSTQSR